MGKKHKKHKSEKKSDEEKVEKHESIKLVLKVGGAETPSQHHDSSHKHKHKKKKKKKSSDREKHRHHEHDKKEKKDKKREREVTEEEVSQDIPIEPPAKRPTLEDDINLQRRLREPRNLLEGEEVTPLQSCLNYLQKMLQRKDVNGFFAFPVNDIIAPGYSSIIMHPMDFSTMKEKIDNADYENVTEYKRDFKLMCENCMVYNHPDTVYYKVAQKLLQSGLKAMSKEKLSYMKKSLGFMASLTSEELGLDQEEMQVTIDIEVRDTPPVKPIRLKPKAKPSSHKFEAFADNLTPEEILEQAQAAAKDAADTLTMRQPLTKMGFLRRNQDGSTSLNVLNPENNGIVSETERVITIGSMTGKLSSGTGSISGFKEDKRNKANPYLYLNYGPFSSYAPSYDSSFSNLTKDESDLLLSTYGDETSVQYAKSIRDFVSGCGDYVSKMADSLLDILTGGEHGKTMKVFHEKKQREDEERKKQEMEVLQALQGQSSEPVRTPTESMEKKKNQSNTDFNSLRSLSELGIDTSFLDSYEKQQTAEQAEVQTKLDQTTQLINELQKSQTERLSQKPPAHLAHLPGPTDKEMELAENVTKHLTDLAKKVGPGQIVSSSAVRSALGISMAPAEGSTEENEDAHSQVLTQMSGEEPPPDIERDLQDFLDQGPVLRVCESPTIGKDGTPVTL